MNIGGLIGGIILIMIGISALTGISLFNFLFAIIMIIIGIWLVSGRSWHHAWWKHTGNVSKGYVHEKSASHEDSIDEVAIFSGLYKKLLSSRFRGGKIVAVFSGGEIDLGEVKTDVSEINLHISAVFSNIELIVPASWKVERKANAFFGNIYMQNEGDSQAQVTLKIEGDAVFGEVIVRTARSI